MAKIKILMCFPCGKVTRHTSTFGFFWTCTCCGTSSGKRDQIVRLPLNPTKRVCHNCQANGGFEQQPMPSGWTNFNSEDHCPRCTNYCESCEGKYS